MGEEKRLQERVGDKDERGNTTRVKVNIPIQHQTHLIQEFAEG